MLWCRSRLADAKGSQLSVFRSVVVSLNIEGKKFELSVVVIDPLTSEAILGLDVLTRCTVDLPHRQLITGAGHVVNMHYPGQNLEWKTNHVDVCECETVNTSISEDHFLLGQLVDGGLPQGESADISHTGDIHHATDISYNTEPLVFFSCRAFSRVWSYVIS